MALIPRGTLVLHAHAVHEERSHNGCAIGAWVGGVGWCSIHVWLQIVRWQHSIIVQMTEVVVKPPVFLSHENDVIDGLQRGGGGEAGSYGLGPGRRESASARAGARATPSAKRETSSGSCGQCHLRPCRKSVSASRAAINSNRHA